jgi:hypothetical protein
MNDLSFDEESVPEDKRESIFTMTSGEIRILRNFVDQEKAQRASASAFSSIRK